MCVRWTFVQKACYFLKSASTSTDADADISWHMRVVSAPLVRGRPLLRKFLKRYH